MFTRIFGSPAGSTTDYPLGYIPAIDGIRGFMPFGVLAAHIHYSWFPGAIVFMNVFFILSAYLITSLLLRDLGKYGTIRFRIFYIRRFLRLFPAYYGMLLVFLLVCSMVLPDPVPAYKDILVAGLYMSNWARAFAVKGPDWLGHTWSLSIEEQFYLCWPVLFFLLVRCFGLGRRLFYILLGATACFTLWRYELAAHGAPIVRLYNGTDVRADTLLIGCLIAIVFSQKIFHTAFLKKIGHALLVPLAILIFGILGFLLRWQNVAIYTWGTTCIDITVGMFVIGLVTTSGTVVHRFFENRVLIYLGKMSYSTYLWHYPIFKFMYRFHFSQWEFVVYGGLLTYFMSFLSYNIIEKPCMRLKRKFV